MSGSRGRGRVRKVWNPMKKWAIYGWSRSFSTRSRSTTGGVRKSQEIQRPSELGVERAFGKSRLKGGISSVSEIESRGRRGIGKPADLKVKETLLHLALFRHQALIIYFRRCAKLNTKGRSQGKVFLAPMVSSGPSLPSTYRSPCSPSTRHHAYPKDPARNHRSWGSDRRGRMGWPRENSGTNGRERDQNKIWTNLHVPMPLEVKDGKTADISQRVHVDSELSEEIHDRRCAIWEGEP